MVTLINNVLLRAYTAVSTLRHRLAEQRGQDLIEYALLSGLVAASLVAGFVLFDEAIGDMVAGIGDCINFDGVGCDATP